MALVYIDGFDTYATADLVKRGWSLQLPGGCNAGISSTAGRRGGGAFQGPLNSWRGYIQRSVTASSALIIGFYFNASTTGGSNKIIAGFLDVSTWQAELHWNADGTLSLMRNGNAVTGGTSTATILANTAYYIEIKVSFSTSVAANSCVVRVNGSPVITVAAGQSMQATANASANQVVIGCPNDTTNTGMYWSYDDFYLCDTTGTANNDFLGDVRIDALLPNGAGTNQQFSVSGANNHYAALADTTPDTTTFVYSNTVGAKETETIADLTNVTGSIKGIQVTNMALKDDAGTRSVANLIRSGTTESQGTSTALSTSQTGISTVVETDPATGAAWTQSGINALEAGVIVTG